MKTSESIKQLAAALAKAQGQIEGASKDSVNPHFGKSYADLASVWDAIRAALTANGLSVVQSPENPMVVMPDTTVAVKDTKIITVVTRLCHESGEWIEGSLSMMPVKVDPQGLGSAITYARRYALAAIVGVYQIDDDANSASHPPQGRTQQPQIEVIGGENAQKVLAALKDAGQTIENLYEAMTANGVSVQSTDVGKWPKQLLPRIFKWCEAKKNPPAPATETPSTPVASRIKAAASRGKPAPVQEPAPV